MGQDGTTAEAHQEGHHRQPNGAEGNAPLAMDSPGDHQHHKCGDDTGNGADKRERIAVSVVRPWRVRRCPPRISVELGKAEETEQNGTDGHEHQSNTIEGVAVDAATLAGLRHGSPRVVRVVQVELLVRSYIYVIIFN